MSKYLYLAVLILLASCLQTNSNADKNNATATITDTTLFWADYRTGELPPEGYYAAFDSIIRKWHIRYQRTEGGCEAISAEKQMHEAGNEKYFHRLEAKFGKDWRKRFDAEVKELDSLLGAQESLRVIGIQINGDFNGDKQADGATVVRTKARQGNPVEDGIPDEYEIQFSGHLKPIKAGCCAIRLVNEGDLNGDGTDELSLFQAPMNGCTYTMKTYSCNNKSWKQIVQPFLVPTACDYWEDTDLQKLVFLENNQVYYYETDVSDEDVKSIKKNAMPD